MINVKSVISHKYTFTVACSNTVEVQYCMILSVIFNSSEVQAGVGAQGSPVSLGVYRLTNTRVKNYE